MFKDLQSGGFLTNFKAAFGLSAGAGFGWTLGVELAKLLTRLIKWLIAAAIAAVVGFTAQCNPSPNANKAPDPAAAALVKKFQDTQR